MRKQFINIVSKIVDEDNNTVLLLGDIGVFGFLPLIFNHPKRAINLGILEQSMISVAAGLSMSGNIPIVHTIAPFIVERGLEQLKLDFGYQYLRGTFITVGSSCDNAYLGSTHHCPADISLINTIPNFNIFIPGNSIEFDTIVNNKYKSYSPNYIRISEQQHTQKIDIKNNCGTLIKKGSKATIICFGHLLDDVINVTKDLDVTILYYHQIKPFDKKLLLENFNKNIIIVEPMYSGSINNIITECLEGKYYTIHNIGIPRIFLDTYGTIDDINKHIGLDIKSIGNKIKSIIKW
jgi:transketolase